MVLWSLLLVWWALVSGSWSALSGTQDWAEVLGMTNPWRNNCDPSTAQIMAPVLPIRDLAKGISKPIVGIGFTLPRRSQSRQLQPEQSSAISVQCGEDTMVVTVRRDLYGNGKLIKTSDLSLGPRSCSPGPQSSDTSAVFDVPLLGCGNYLQVTPDWLVYTSQLNYSPKPTNGVPIARTKPAVHPIQCYYPRQSNGSSTAFNPTWIPFNATVTTKKGLSFSLRLMMDDWSAPRPSSIFQLGATISIEAAVETQSPVPMTVFVDSCVATLTPDPNSNPRYEIIAYNGCLVDGKQEDSSSAFTSPRPQPDKLRFTVDAFRFIGTDGSTIYITCTLKAVARTQAPDSVNKACTFTKTLNGWSPVEGPNATCTCCNTGNCVGQSKRLKSAGKKSPMDSSRDDHGIVTLGPILVT